MTTNLHIVPHVNVIGLAAAEAAYATATTSNASSAITWSPTAICSLAINRLPA